MGLRIGLPVTGSTTTKTVARPGAALLFYNQPPQRHPPAHLHLGLISGGPTTRSFLQILAGHARQRDTITPTALWHLPRNLKRNIVVPIIEVLNTLNTIGVIAVPKKMLLDRR